MANELNIALPTSGLTVTAQRYQAGTAIGSPISLTEIGSTGFYSGNMTGTAGTYLLTFIADGKNVGSGQIAWDGTSEIALPAALRSELATELARIDATVSSRLADADYTAPANSDIAAVKTVTDALNTSRLGNVATVESTGAALATALTAP